MQPDGRAADRGGSGRRSSRHRTYVHGDAQDDLIAFENGATRYVPHRDRRGSIVALTDTAGRIVERYTYDPYGRRRVWAAATTATSPARPPRSGARPS